MPGIIVKSRLDENRDGIFYVTACQQIVLC